MLSKFTATMTGDGVRMSWLFRHDLGTVDLVTNLRTANLAKNRGMMHGILGNVISVSPDQVLVSFTEPLDEGEEITLVLIG